MVSFSILWAKPNAIPIQMRVIVYHGGGPGSHLGVLPPVPLPSYLPTVERLARSDVPRDSVYPAHPVLVRREASAAGLRAPEWGRWEFAGVRIWSTEIPRERCRELAPSGEVTVHFNPVNSGVRLTCSPSCVRYWDESSGAARDGQKFVWWTRLVNGQPTPLESGKTGLRRRRTVSECTAVAVGRIHPSTREGCTR